MFFSGKNIFIPSENERNATMIKKFSSSSPNKTTLLDTSYNIYNIEREPQVILQLLSQLIKRLFSRPAAASIYMYCFCWARLHFSSIEYIID